MVTQLEFRIITDVQKQLLVSHVSQRLKKSSTYALWCLFTGGVGGHWFYEGKIFVGIMALCFCWTFIPIVVSFFCLFLSKTIIANYNKQIYETAYRELFAITQVQST